MKVKEFVKNIKKVIRMINRYVSAHSAGSIFGRAVYASPKSKTVLEKAILGVKVYNSKKVESKAVWEKSKKSQK